MSDFNSCEFGAITPELIFAAISRGFTSLAVEDYSCGIGCTATSLPQSHARTTPIICGSPADLMELIKQALVMADDGKVALRTATISSEDGADFDECVGCQNGETWYQLASRMFAYDANGDVCVLIALVS